MLQPPPGLRTIKGDKYKEAVASLWEHAEPDAQRLLREAGIPPPEEAGEESPASSSAGACRSTSGSPHGTGLFLQKW